MQTMAAALITAVFLAIPFLGPLPGAEAGPARVVPKGGMLFPPGDPTGARRLAAARLQWNLVETGRASVIPGPAAWNLANLTGKSFLTTVKDQGGCASCVAFSVLSALETSINYKLGQGTRDPAGNRLPNLSEQDLYFCQGKRTCSDGWYFDEAMDIAIRGLADDACMPYGGAPRYCKVPRPCDRPALALRYGTATWVELNTWDAVKRHIVNHGPVVTGFNLYADFPGQQDSRTWSFGPNYVWNGTKSTKLMSGHAVMCYGYDDNMPTGAGSNKKGVVFCRNSWGASWGDKGNFKAAYGADGLISGEMNTYGFIWTKNKIVAGPGFRPTTSKASAPKTTQKR